jgi:GxxExxY protein
VRDESPESAIARTRTREIIGAAMEVHNRLGHGFAEPVYQAALEVEFVYKGVPFVRECQLPVSYRGRQLAVSYRADFICWDAIIVELKATAKLIDADRSQVMNYLKATGFARGLVFNFGTERLEFRRILWAPNLSKSVSSADRDGAK